MTAILMRLSGLPPTLLFWALKLLFSRVDPEDRCGPQGSWKAKFIPDRLFGVSIRWACEIHDVDYSRGHDEMDRKIADRVFFWNILDTYQMLQPWPLWVVCGLTAAWLYYRAVRLGGKSAFLAGKGTSCDTYEV